MIKAIEEVAWAVKNQPKAKEIIIEDRSPLLLKAVEDVVISQKDFKLKFSHEVINKKEIISAIKKISNQIQTSFTSPNKYTHLKTIKRSRDENLHSDYIAAIIRQHPEIIDQLNLKGKFLNVLREARLDYFQSSLKGDYLGARRIDILIETTKSFLIIENKIDSQELNDQTGDYYKVIKNNTNKEVKGIMLSPMGLNPSCEQYRRMTYYQLFIILSQIKNKSEILEYYLSELFDIFIKPYNKEQK